MPAHARLHAVPTPHPDPAPPSSRRGVHFVGSLPAELGATPRERMQWFLDHADGTDQLTLPCDTDPQWILGWLHALADVPSLQPCDEPAAGHHGLPVYRLAPGARLTPHDVSLYRAGDVDAVMAARARLHTGRPLPPHQVSLPSPLDLAYFCFGSSRAAMAAQPLFRTAVARDAATIHEQWGQRVVFQLETPAVLTLIARTERRLWPPLVLGLARQTAALLTALPARARWILHLCHGDLDHRPFTEPTELVPAVLFCNALARELAKAHHRMPTVHLPLATATTPPPEHPRFYRALAHLRAHAPLIAGLVDEHHPDRSSTALRLLEQALGDTVHAIAAPCGHGRRTAADATANAALARALAHAPHDAHTPPIHDRLDHGDRS